MPRAQAFADMPNSAESAWQKVGSFQGIGTWHPFVVGVLGDGEQPGAERILELVDGQRLVERLEVMDVAHRRYRYTMTATKMPIRDYVGELRVRQDGLDRSCVIWTAEFTVTSGDDTAAIHAVQEFLDAGARGIEERYAPGAASSDEGGYAGEPDTCL